MNDETEVLAVEARLKDYISANLQVINSNIQQFSGQAKTGFDQAASSSDGFTMSVKGSGKEMIQTGRETSALLRLMSGFGLVPPQLAAMGGGIREIGASMKLLALDPVFLGIAAITAAGGALYQFYEKAKETHENMAELDQLRKE